MIRLTRKRRVNGSHRTRLGTAFGHVQVKVENGLEIVETDSNGVASALEKLHGFQRSPLGQAIGEFALDVAEIVGGPVGMVIKAIDALIKAGNKREARRLRDAEINRKMGPRKTVMQRLAEIPDLDSD